MQYDQFIGQVQDRAHLPSRGDAEKAVRATLAVLSTRLTAGAARSLAGQLPDLVAEHLVGDLPEGDRTGESFDSDEFLRRVSEQEHADLPVAAHHARAVLEIVGAAVGQSEIDKIRDQLPDDYDRLFAGSEGRMSV